jgi:DNA-binding NtrC family response regulator
MSMKPRALVVDDDQTMVKTLSDLLRLKGWEVTTAFSGDAAVQAAVGADFDIVLMDIKMPGMDGVDAFKAMKTARPDIRVVLMTAYAGQDRILEAEREGVVRVLAKPVHVPSLLELMAATLGSGQQPVLLIDHDALFLKTMAEVLRLRGFEVVVAHDLFHAKHLMLERRPLAVLLHVHMGASAVREAVAVVHDVSPSVALILYSGQPGAEEEIERTLPAEWVHTYLQKPFAVEQVTGVLDDIRRAG